MVKKEIESLAAETLAFGAILAMVFHKLSRVNPTIAAAISSGFDDAAGFVESTAMKRGKSTPPQYVVEALRIVEQLRVASLGNQQKPKRRVWLQGFHFAFAPMRG
jgi:hypothetical protein